MKFITPTFVFSCLVAATQVSGFTSTFTPKSGIAAPRSGSSLQMVDANVIQGAAVALLGLGAGIGVVAFTEAQGERARERGGGLSDSMSTQLSGMFMEDVEVSSVDDVGSLADQLEAALKASGGTTGEELEMTEEEKQKIAEEADDGW